MVRLATRASKRGLASILACLVFSAGLGPGAAETKPEPMLLVVLDPLAKELACACVKGYGQRDYRKLAAHLRAATQENIAIEFSDDLADSLAGINPGREVVMIGEHSSVQVGARNAGVKCTPVCELTGLDGSTVLSGSFVVRSGDPLKNLTGVAGRKILLGVGHAEALGAAAKSALRAANPERQAQIESRGSYTDAALDVLDSQSSPAPVALVPSYALRLLEGCGSITPGDLKEIARTEPVRFITVFVGDRIPTAKREKIIEALLKVKEDASLLRLMESRDGFKLLMPKSEAGQPHGGSWPDWRGAARDGRVPQLPSKLPERPKILWRKGAMSGGLCGLTVSDGQLILAERDFAEEHDVYRCLDADTGELQWRLQFPARGKLDYGQSPRATPVVHHGKAYLLGALGELRCVDLTAGEVIWKKDLLREFGARVPTWGMCSPPLIAGDLLIVNPGAADASLVALECATGRTRWRTPGAPAAYSAFIVGEFGGHKQVVGYDQSSLGGWDVTTGKRLWRLVPAVEGDFNVPTPAAVEDGVIVSSENNGTRLYGFDNSGRVSPTPVAEFADLAPGTASPVVTCGRLFGAHAGLYCLDIRSGLKLVWSRDEPEMGDHASLIADSERVLVITLTGELILLDGRADHCAVISRVRLFDDEVEVYSHPALIANRLYARGGSAVICADLSAN